MRLSGVVVITLCGLLACGRDPILERAEAEATRAAEIQSAGRPTQPPPGADGAPGGATRPDGGPDGGGGQGLAQEPAPGVPDEPLPGAPGSPQLAVPGGAAPVAVGSPRVGIPTQPAPGVPSEPPPGGGGGPPGPTVVVSGEVFYAEWTKGKVKISAFDGDHGTTTGGRPNVVGMAEMSRPGPFTLSVAENIGKIYVEAAVDENDDGRPGPLDPQGKASRFPITVAASPILGVTITLTRRAPPPGGRGEDF